MITYTLMLYLTFSCIGYETECSETQYYKELQSIDQCDSLAQSVIRNNYLTLGDGISLLNAEYDCVEINSF